VPQRTQIFKQLPWNGGLNTSLDAMMIPPAQLSTADNILVGTRPSRLKRDGIDFCYDNAEVTTLSRSSSGTTRTIVVNGASFAVGDNITVTHTGTVNSSDSLYNGTFTITAVTTTTIKNDTITFTASGMLTESSTADTKAIVQLNSGTQVVLGEIDFWYGATTKTQALVTLMSDGTVYATTGGKRVAISVTGNSWTTPLTTCSMTVFGNKVFFAVSGANNYMKYWDGTNPVVDVPAAWNTSTLQRSSSGTTRTIVMNYTVPVQVGNTLVVQNMGNSAYNGTFTISSITTTNMSNDTLVFTGTSSLTESTTTDTGGIVGGLAPPASFVQNYLGRIVCNDKTNPDRVHMCQTDNWSLWYGYGDSGSVDVGVGDGDPIGVTAISPQFRTALFVGKKTKVYRLSGQSPATISINKVSDGFGVESHNSFVPIEDQMLLFVSEKGVHALTPVDFYGDFRTDMVSEDIQGTFLSGLNLSRLKNCWAGYLPAINSAAFTFTETSSLGRKNTTSAVNNALYLYNFKYKAWYRWPDISCQSLCVSNDSDQKRFYLGSHLGRISKTFIGSNYDYSPTNTPTAIPYVVASGQLAPDGDEYTMKAFKRLIIFYKPTGTHTITATVTIDNTPINSENELSFSQIGSTAILGSTFTLGSSVLGYEEVTGPYTATIDGIGRTATVTIEQNTLNETVEIQGFALEWEPAGTSPETFLF
jgi:hypothetical protein